MRILTLIAPILLWGFTTTASAQQVQMQGQSLPPEILQALQGVLNPQPPTGKMPELADARLWFNSKPVPSKDLRGHVVLIDFWAYDCPGCLTDLPNVIALDTKYRSQGLQVIAVQPAVASFQKDSTSVEDAIHKLKIPYPIVFDSTGKIAEAFHNNIYPNRFYIDKQGNIRNMGSKSAEGAIEELLAEQSDSASVPSK